MKLIALHKITDGKRVIKKGEEFETDKVFTESLVPKSAKYALPSVSEQSSDKVEQGSDNVSKESNKTEENENVEVEIPDDLEALNEDELQELCKKLNINYEGMDKEALIQSIEDLFEEE